MAGASALDLLSPRERDCLRLLRAGLDTPQVATSLGISLSTLNKHLASARRKLGVTRTAQALLLSSWDGESASNRARVSRETIANGHGPLVSEFANALEACETFNETWEVMLTHAAAVGVTNITCGLVAEPPGQLTNGARAVAMSYPEHMKQMYRDMGGERADPTVPYTVAQTKPVLVDNEYLMKTLGERLPKPVATMGYALLDHKMRFAVHAPERDDLTGAPMVSAFVIDPRAVDDVRHRQSPLRGLLNVISRMFWDAVQNKSMLRHMSGLTPRQVEALTLAARGLSVAETAEHMGVSSRSAEKMLAGARNQLGARTTAAAVYRAMVYRALG